MDLLRRLVGFLLGVTALAAPLQAGAALQPVRRPLGETAVPRVRAGVVQVPARHSTGRIRVIVTLPLPPLAAAYGRTFAATAAHRRLDVADTASRRYLARVVAAQRRAASELRKAIPEARLGARFQVVLDGMTVSLPATRLPTLVRLGFVARVYPSLRYTLDTNRSPAVIGADVLHATTGANGEGIKIGIVDDGVDATNPFLSPSGYSYPAGFPKGGRQWTSEKVIAARAFPGPGSGRRGTLPVDPSASFHGTHVAGIAAGDAGTCSPGGEDHPPTCGLSGVAPRAYLGNYRVFTVPTPIGHVANTPEIVQAFEAAVRDGMDVINFSGGGPESEPANDAMIETVRNVVIAGVVPVIAAGNDRDDAFGGFGTGTVGSPGTAPDAITVAAVSNSHVFSPTMTVQAANAPATLESIPIVSGAGSPFPNSFAARTRPIFDVGTFRSRDGVAVDRRLCGPDDDPNNPAKSSLAVGSLLGEIALISRGHCTFASKAVRAYRAGATAVVIVDNRPGEPSGIPIGLPMPAGMISDLDGARLRAYLATTGGAAPVTIGHVIEQVDTGRSGVVTSFSSAGLTDFQDLLKPDVAAPGGQVLSSTLPEFAHGASFAVFDGTSMATPHVSGSAALLLQLHPGWSPQQVKSALVSTAAPAAADTGRTTEAPVPLEGGGLVNLPRAADPKILTDPASLSFQSLDVTRGSRSRALLVRVSDAGDGFGTWQVELAPQSATPGATVELPGPLAVPLGGEGDLAVVARASADATPGENYGFVVLRRGDVTRRIPYAFVVERPQLATVEPRQLHRFDLGETINGPNRVDTYCCPSSPFGAPPDWFGPPMDESGAEKLYVTTVKRPLVNLGVSVVTSSGVVDPWFLGSPNERDVQGYAGTPVNVNNLMFDYHADIGAAGAEFPKRGQFYVAVDSRSDPFTHRSFPGSFLLRSWQDDLRPPRLKLLTTRVGAGRPTIVARALDSQSGVDPLSLVIGYRRVLVGAALYDPFSGLAVFPLPQQAARIPVGKTRTVAVASDFQEAKNLEMLGSDIMPNTAYDVASIRGVRGPAITWLAPLPRECVSRTVPLAVAASSTGRVVSVRFLVDGRRVAIRRRNAAGLFVGTWRAGRAARGRHVLRAVATDARHRHASAVRAVRICK